MMSSIAIVVLLLVLLGYVYLTFFVGSMAIDLFKLLNISSLLKVTWWQDNVSVAQDLILEQFSLGEERIFSGVYISHWEIPRFRLMSVDCQLDIPFEGGWDWLTEALENPTTRDDCSGKFDLEFRGMIIEKGHFGHIGMCSYRIEVIEILTVDRLI
ncbi:hypothetical protein [Chamaesiphon sp. VAR_48_metabat_403]|uniref:hypothetical protein n=1 Tax=Chamaesiphon sp. VAR_48_metabat_403 TaxID=2964700 RepID=UPI00286D7CC6|nr:hypothetical protein [Chamaesiphon sp. VAR_48_metabat_403]